jgi:hypothetical protein
MVQYFLVVSTSNERDLLLGREYIIKVETGNTKVEVFDLGQHYITTCSPDFFDQWDELV